MGLGTISVFCLTGLFRCIKKRQKSLKNALFFTFPWKSQKYSLSLHQEKTKGDIMDKRFTPRSNEEMLAAVRAFQARQREWFKESDKRLEKRVIEHELAV